MERIRLHYLLGDVHLGGHDVHRVAKAACRLLEATGAFDVRVVCDDPYMGHIPFDEYLSGDAMRDADAFVFHCGNARFNVRWEQEKLEAAVAGGAGFLLMHGEHPCYWPAAGMAPWEGFERMAGHLWRERTTHGDYGSHSVTIRAHTHPVMRGLPDFDTRDEVFCTMENPHGVPFSVLATAWSDPAVVSRHGQPGTGRHEPVALAGQYGEGRTFNLGLGHVWPFYTGHGLGEDTMAAWAPIPLRMLFVRACEWVATGVVEATAGFAGHVRLHDV